MEFNNKYAVKSLKLGIGRKEAPQLYKFLFSYILEVLLLMMLIGQSKVAAEMPTSQFLLVGQGARAEAMGEAIVADCYDQSATYWNPAGMSYARYTEIGFNTVPLVGNIMVNSLSFVYPGKKYSFGLRVITMASAMDNIDWNGVQLPQGLSENDSNMDVFASCKLLDYVAVGIGVGSTLMQYNTPSVTYSASTTNENLGIIYNRNFLSIALSVDNIGDNVKLTGDSPGEPQPEVIRIGAAYKTLDANNLTFAAAVEDSVYDKNASGCRFGSEYAFNQYFAARGGLIFENNGDTKPTMGFGAYYEGFGLDFSTTLSPSSMSDINTFRFGLSYKFGSTETDTEQ